MQNLFPYDSYDTPDERRQCLADRMLFNSRAYFYFHNFLVFVRTGMCAKKGLLSADKQVFYSNMNINLVERCGGKIHIRGLDNINKLQGRAAVLMGNHMSLLETALFHAIIRPRIDFTFVIKESLLDVPFFGNIMRALGAIPVTRTNPKEDFKQVLKLGRETLAAGKSIILFPQSTRSSQFNPENFNSIGVKLAKSAGVPILPFALKTDFIGNGKILRDMGPIHRNRAVCFTFGEPIEVAGNGKEELQQVISFIQNNLEQWRKIYPEKQN